MEGAVGYIRHHAIIVTTWPSTKAAMLVREFRKFGLPVTEPVKSVRNSVWTFLIGPDGSNEFWDTSERYDMLRDEAVRVLALAGVKWAEVLYHDEEGAARVVRDSRSTRNPPPRLSRYFQPKPMPTTNSPDGVAEGDRF